MIFAQLLRTARSGAALTLRALGERAGTSHSTLAAYESGRKTPSVETFDRIVRAAGFTLEVRLARRIVTSPEVGMDRGAELAAVLELAEEFPARHAEQMTYPVFGR